MTDPTPADRDRGCRLAIDGGKATFPAGPPSWPGDHLDANAVSNLFHELARDKSWAAYHGPRTERVRDCVSELTTFPEVRLCSSGTIAVELALRGLGVVAGEEVALGAYDFPGNFRAIESIGAKPVLLDISQTSGCLEVAALEQLAATTSATALPKCIIVSHLHGGLARMRSIMDWAAQHNVVVLEDICQAPGAIVDGQPAGSWGDASVLSFGGSKLLTAGRGGAVACREPAIHQRMKVWADRGNDAFPMSQLQASVLPCQFAKLSELNTIRQASGQRICSALETMADLKPIWTQTEEQRPAGYKLGIWLNNERFNQPLRDRWIAAIQAEGIALDRGFRGFARRSERRCRKIGNLEIAQHASEFGVVLHHPILLASAEIQTQLCNAIDRVTRTVLG